MSDSCYFQVQRLFWRICLPVILILFSLAYSQWWISLARLFGLWIMLPAHHRDKLCFVLHYKWIYPSFTSLQIHICYDPPFLAAACLVLACRIMTAPILVFVLKAHDHWLCLVLSHPPFLVSLFIIPLSFHALHLLPSLCLFCSSPI